MESIIEQKIVNIGHVEPLQIDAKVPKIKYYLLEAQNGYIFCRYYIFVKYFIYFSDLKMFSEWIN